jgi:hypothetical protein
MSEGDVNPCDRPTKLTEEFPAAMFDVIHVEDTQPNSFTIPRR